MSVIFDGTILNDLDGVNIVSTNELGTEPKQRSLIDIPGRDYPYDFGNHHKNHFPIMVDFKLNEENDSNLSAVISSFKTALSKSEAKTLTIYGQSYTAQIFDGVQVETNVIRNTATASVVFECWIE